MNNDDIIKKAHKRHEAAIEADRENREQARDDIDNVIGRQWPDAIKNERETDRRPIITINKLAASVRQVTGDIRRLNPAINIIPSDDDSSEETAEVIEGLVRNIQYKSDASSVYEGAAESAAQCGMGHFRVLTDYESDTSFNQEIKIKRIHNPFSVYCDPAAKMPTREDADWQFITEIMEKEDFEGAYPDASCVDVPDSGEPKTMSNWRESGSVVVAEYFWKEPETYEIGLLSDGRVVRDPKPPLNFVARRKVQGHKVKWAKISGKDVLEGPLDIPCDYIPIIWVTGEEIHFDDEVVRSSVVRYAKDPQRLYNYWRSAQTEMVALQPKSPFLVTPKQIEGHEAHWAAANNANFPYLTYNPDPKAPAVPQRSQPPISSQGMMQEVMNAAEDIKATTGIYDAGLGARSNETSGIAIRQRQMESDTSTSIYTDNLSKAISFCGRIIVSMIPKVYDTKRTVRITSKDDSEKAVVINDIQFADGGVVPINNVKNGSYDVRVTVGPNYSTKRQETAESMIDFIRAFPNAAAVTGDLVAKHMDWPGADQFEERLKKILPPGLVDPDDLPPEQQQQIMQQQEAQQQEAEEAAAAQRAMFMAEMEAKAAAVQKTQAETALKESEVELNDLESAQKQFELAMQSGLFDEAIQREVARALQGVNVPMGQI